MEGWICLYKKLINWEWYQDGNTCRLFIHLLLLANYEDKSWQGQLIKRGQLITSSEHLAKDLNLSRQQVRTAINKLKSTNEITTKSTNKYTLITIEKYEDYQSKTDKSNQQNNKQSNKQITTTNNITNNKLNYTKLNLLFDYLIYKENEFESLQEYERENIVRILTRLEQYTTSVTYISEDKIIDLKLQYWAITELYLSPYKLYMDKLNVKNFVFRFLKAKEYINYESGEEEDLKNFMKYFIKCLREEMKSK